MGQRKFSFAHGNIRKLLAAPKYLLAALFALCVPRSVNTWVFGSGVGVGEGALTVAQSLQATDHTAQITWIVADEHEAAEATALGFAALYRSSWSGFWATLRAEYIVVTHGLGDVNRYGVFGGTVINLIHGAPLKKLHLDSNITTALGGPAPLRAILKRMYQVGTGQFTLIVAGSVTAAERLRSAYRVDPGRVAVLGDPRDDVLAAQKNSATLCATAREHVRSLLNAQFVETEQQQTVFSAAVTVGSGTTAGAATVPNMFSHIHRDELLVLYAPTWRDGASDPAIPTPAEVADLQMQLARLGAHLVIRSHPLGAGAYADAIGGRIHELSADTVRDITPVLAAFDAVITDYSSIALDYALLERPIVWFAPDLQQYSDSRGLYEPLQVTASGRVTASWAEAANRLQQVLVAGPMRRLACDETAVLARRFHEFQDAGSAERVLYAIRQLHQSDAELVPAGGVFFESFYGRQVSCNPLALDREISSRFPNLARYWSVTSERTVVPEGAQPVLVGSKLWFAVRRQAQLLIVNDWLRYRFKRSAGQTVLQAWHGTMLKHLALGRPNVGWRTRLAIRRESQRWSLLLSQNPHSTQQFRSSYAYQGEVLESGYPRDDRLAKSVVAHQRIPLVQQTARRALGIAASGTHVLAYVPTWRSEGSAPVDVLNVQELAEQLGADWVVVARGHTRTLGGYRSGSTQVIDASEHADVNDVLLAADVLVTDYSSVMFDASVAEIPMVFFVPDIVKYRDHERGFTFDFDRLAPGPLVSDSAEVVQVAQQIVRSGGSPTTDAPFADRYLAWQQAFNPADDGAAAQRVVDRLVQLGALPSS